MMGPDTTELFKKLAAKIKEVLVKKKVFSEKCPFCAEDIQEEAIKCKHCGEWLREHVQVPPSPLVKTKDIKSSRPHSEDTELLMFNNEIKRKMEAGLRQCPICGKWDVQRAIIKDGGFGDWCPHCNKSLPQEIPQLKGVGGWLLFFV
jgi:ribosomal protein L32